MQNIIRGRLIAKQIKDFIKEDITKLKISKVPGLATVLVGDNPESKLYIRKKNEACEELGFYFHKILLPEKTAQGKLLEVIEEFNKNDKIHGILVQLPLPAHLDEKKIISSVDPSKDVDGFHPLNMGNTLMGEEYLVPCTPLAVLKILEYEKVNLKGKSVVVINHSYHIGKPLAAMLLNRNASVTITHKYTSNLRSFVQKSDILITATGIPKLITKDFVKRNSIVIDVGIVRQANGSICGDVDFDQVKHKVKAITPVPGGVGPVTVACLMLNTYKVFKKEVCG
jgi:methylenetetrahydrofolate dehydrogenase (NADP+)/methenyltetrahydrofolate cyclohydrolase